MAATKQQLTVEGRNLTLSNLEKVLYPAVGFTKAQIIDYYARVSGWILPHLKDRPVTLKRYPDGVEGQAFYEKDAPKFTPEWVTTANVPRRAGGTPIRYVLINDLPTLIWCANIASLELHPFLHRADNLDQPTAVVFDLDPGEGTTIVQSAKVALLLRSVLEGLDLQSFPKFSGSKGIQVYVPLNTPVSYEATQPFALSLARMLEEQHKDLVVSEMAKNLRTGKVFIDWSQNSDFKTTVSVYSLRAKSERPYVSYPVTWEEVESLKTSKDAERVRLSPEEALKRFEKVGDLFEPMLSLKQKLPATIAKDVAKDVPQALETYRKKRDFSKTAEPAPAAPSAINKGSERKFVIQKHAASHLHYDFRLEMNGVLKSWAVPKGVPYALNERRLAMATEDHPIEYLDFEGTIPKGQYGGGTVMVWDIGTYELVDGNYYKGKLHFVLKGKKLKGEWALVGGNGSEKNRWFLLKVDKPMKALTAKAENASAITGRTLDQIASSNDAQWHSNRSEIPGLEIDKLPKAELEFVTPMMAKLAGELPEGGDWKYEIKLDGYRALAIKKNGNVKLLSRRNHSLNTRFAAIAEGFKGLEDGIEIDGEVVALDDNGRPSFSLLQNDKKGKQPVVYYAFDILAYRGRSLMELPLSQRREVLQAALKDVGEPIRVSSPLEGKPADLVAAVRKHGLEGIVAKRADSRYEPGERSGAWMKYKVNQGQELVIGGYKPGANGFDNLAVGYYDGGRLQFIGKIKNGFVPAVKAEVASEFEGLETKTCPFANLPEPRNARRGEALTAEAMKKYKWLRPKLVAQVEFTDWTDANHLRHSRFVALRDDKDAREVGREAAVEATA